MAGSSDAAAAAAAAAAGAGAPMLRLLPQVGSRPRELTGAVDLVTHYGLHDLYDHFCRKPLQASIADSPYLQQVVGHTELRRGDGMELSQLLTADPAEAAANQAVKSQPFDLQVLQWAFTLQETGPIELPEADKGLATICGNVKYDKEKKHRKKHKKHKHREKDKKDADNDRGKGEGGEDHSNKKHRKKKRKHGEAQEDGDGHKHKRKKHKHSSKTEGVMKNGK